MYVESFKDLIVWQRSIELVKEIYQLTDLLPEAEKFGLIGQMRRAAVAIPSNIAEGKKRKTAKDFLQFLRVADGSAAELETQIIIVKQLYNGVNCNQAELLLTEVQKMLITMIKRLGDRSA